MLCVKHSGFQVSTRLRPALRPIFHFKGIETFFHYLSKQRNMLCFAALETQCQPATQHLFSDIDLGWQRFADLKFQEFQGLALWKKWKTGSIVISL